MLALAFAGHAVTVHGIPVELFPTEIRSSAYAVGYALSTIVFGGASALLVSQLIVVTGSNVVPAYAAMTAAVISLATLRFVPETRGTSPRGRAVAPSGTASVEAWRMRRSWRCGSACLATRAVESAVWARGPQPEIAWPQVRGFRSVLVYRYVGVDEDGRGERDLVWDGDAACTDGGLAA